MSLDSDFSYVLGQVCHVFLSPQIFLLVNNFSFIYLFSLYFFVFSNLTTLKKKPSMSHRGGEDVMCQVRPSFHFFHSCLFFQA